MEYMTFFIDRVAEKATDAPETGHEKSGCEHSSTVSSDIQQFSESDKKNVSFHSDYSSVGNWLISGF